MPTQILFRLATLLFICATVFACSPELRLARKIGVNEKRMERAIVSSGADGKEVVRSLTGQYRVYTRTINALDRDTIMFRRVQNMKPGRFVGPFFNRDSLGVHYFRVVGRTAVAYPVIRSAQLHKAFGVGDQTFNDKVAAIIAACQDDKQLISVVLEAYEEDADIGVGMSLPLNDWPLSKFLPSIHDFMLNAPVFAVKAFDPVEYSHTTITELMQKTAPTVYHDYIEFARIDVLRARPLKKLR